MNKDKILKLAKGFRGRAKNCIRIAKERVEKSLQYAFRDRRNKKREMRSLWITRIGAGSRQYGVSLYLLRRDTYTVRLSPHNVIKLLKLPIIQVKYSQLINGLQQQNIQVNRKILAELAANEPYSFKALVDQVRFMKTTSHT